MSNSSRRGFLLNSVVGGAVAAWALEGQSSRKILIQAPAGTSFGRRLASRELLRGLTRLGIPNEIHLVDAIETHLPAGDLTIAMRIEPEQFQNTESYSITATASNQLALIGAGETALQYAVFEFLERQGAYFGIDGDTYPVDAPKDLVLPAVGQPRTSAPRFAVRGLLPWPDFLNCISVYNEEDFRAYFESGAKALRERRNRGLADRIVSSGCILNHTGKPKMEIPAHI